MSSRRHRSQLRAALLLAFALPACARSPETSERATGLAVVPPGIVATETLLDTTGAVGWSRFGSSVATSGDLLLVGAPGMGVTSVDGAAYVFTLDPATGTWGDEHALLPDAPEFFSFSRSLALDGTTAAVSIPTGRLNGFDQEGAVYLFERDRAWGITTRISDPIVDTGGDFGVSLALAGDLLVVGAVADDGERMVMVFERHRGGPDAWGKVATILTSDVGDPGFGGEVFGASLALAGDTLVIGAPPLSRFSGDRDGSAYVFSRDVANRDLWTFAARLAAADGGGTNDGFGAPVAVEGDTAVVGAPWAYGSDGARDAGAAYVFQRDAASNAFIQAARVTTLEAARFDTFGAAVALKGNALLIGAPTRIVDLEQRGAAFVFRRDATSAVWSESMKLTSSTAGVGDELGFAVALHADTAFVGAPRREADEETIHDFGAVHVFDITEPPPPACQPATEPSQVLVDGGSVAIPSGFTLSAPAGTLSASVSVWVEDVLAPVPTITSDTPIGSYVGIGARCTIASNAGTSFVLELPVPAGADTSRLAVAALVPAAHVMDGPAMGPSWDVIPGVLDAARNVFAVQIAGLTTEGTTFVLVEEAIASPTARAGERSGSLAEDCEGVSPFRVECKTSLGDCPLTDAARELDAAYTDYKAQGFPEPYLKKSGCYFDYVRIYAITHDACASDAEGGNVVAGRYGWTMQSFRICVRPNEPWPLPALRHHIRHEMFHAFQHGLPSYQAMHDATTLIQIPRADRWITEGSADAAVDSGLSMHRAIGVVRKLRSAEIAFAIDQDLSEYEAQDFWVHLFSRTVDGFRRAYPLGDVAGVLSQGFHTSQVASAMRASGGHYRELGDEYWAWAKNQVIDKTDVTFDGALRRPCELAATRLGTPQRISYPRVSQVEGEFENPLQSKGVGIKFRDAVNGVTVQAVGESLAYKVYLVGETGCAAMPDGERFFHTLPAGAEVFVLLGNKSYDSGRSFRVTVAGGG